MKYHTSAWDSQSGCEMDIWLISQPALMSSVVSCNTQIANCEVDADSINNKCKKWRSFIYIIFLIYGISILQYIMHQWSRNLLNSRAKFQIENFRFVSFFSLQLIGRIAPIIGGEALEELFLDNYLEMCSRAATSIRHPCATIFPVMCQVLGTEITEKRMVSDFSLICF